LPSSTQGIGIFLGLWTSWNNFSLNWFGREKNRTEPNRTEINRFEPVSVRFGSVQKIKKKIKSVWLFILVQNRTKPEMLSPTYCAERTWRASNMLFFLASMYIWFIYFYSEIQYIHYILVFFLFFSKKE